MVAGRTCGNGQWPCLILVATFDARGKGGYEMNFCGECGTKLEKDALFCSACGYKISVRFKEENIEMISAQQAYEKVEVDIEQSMQEKVGGDNTNTLQHEVGDISTQKRKFVVSKKLLVCMGALIVIILAGILYITLFYSESDAIVSAVEKGDYTKASEIYEDDVIGNRSLEVEVERALEKKIDEIITQYNEEVVEIQEVEMLLSTLERSGILEESTFLEAYATINVLQESKNAYMLAEKQFMAGEYLDSIEQYELVEKDDINYDASQEKIEESLSLYKVGALDMVEEAIDNEHFDTAFALLNVAGNVLYADSDIQAAYQNCLTAYETCTVAEAIDEANSLIELGNYAKAYSNLLAQTSAFANNLQLTAAFADCKTAYIDNTLEQAEEIFNDEWNYEDAITLIQLALLDIPEDEQLAAAVEAYSTYRPMWVGDLVAFQENGNFSSFSDREIIDNLGETYTNYFYGKPSSWTSSGWGTNAYKLDGAYDTISGRIIIDFDDRNISTIGGYIFTADGVELLNTGTLTGSTEPIDFTLDLTGVSELKISSYARYSVVSWHQYTAALVDTYLTKDFLEIESE